MTLSRGLRVNNPGNIRISPTPWHGKVTPSRDSEFETFDTMENGVRAMTRLILTYHQKYGLNTISDIITRYAPPSENATDAYIHAVSDAVGIDPDATLNFTDKTEISSLMSAIINHEQGNMPLTMAQIDSGVSAAIA